jgi:peptide/nickel transport system permease protein
VAGLARAFGHVLAASLLAFLIVRAAPGDPALLALVAFGQPADATAVSALRAEWGLDRPLAAQYLAWLADFAVGEWGRSFRTGRPVFEEFVARLPVTLGLGCGGLGLALVLAGPLGTASALSPGGIADRLLGALTLGAQAIPAFWLGCALLWIFAVELRLVEVVGDGPRRYVLPVAVLAFAALGPLAQVCRAGLADVARSDYFRAALARGASRREALAGQGRRHATLGLVGALNAEAGWTVGGTAVIETVFGLPGIGLFVVESVAVRDYAVLQAFVAVAVLWMAAIGLAARAARAVLDPRPR